MRHCNPLVNHNVCESGSAEPDPPDLREATHHHRYRAHGKLRDKALRDLDSGALQPVLVLWIVANWM